MKTHSFSVAAFFALSLASLLAQQPVDLVARLQSADWTERRDAFAALAGAERAGAGQILDDRAKSALVSLLSRENEIGCSAVLEGKGSSELYGEGYSRYTASVAEAVMRIAQNAPDRQDVWPALVRSAYDPESVFSRWLATHGDKVAPWLMSTAAGHDPCLSRADALLVLAGIVEYEHRPETTHRMRADEVQEIERTIRGSLSETEKDPVVRYQGIKALAIIGTKDDIALLERIATLDPEFVTNGGQSGQELRYPVREVARNALARLRQRLESEQ